MAEKESKKDIKKAIKKLSKNYWAIATIILAVILIATLSLNPSSGSTVSKTTASEKTLSFLNSQTGGGVELIEVNDNGQFYEVIVSYDGQQIPVYVTKDGGNLVQGLVPLSGQTNTPTQTQTPTPTNVPKSDKPKVELFVMTHCPYGTQAEKGILPVFGLLGNKIDASIKFVHYFLHDPEETETPIQICIREEQPTKYLTYLKEFLDAGDTDAALTAAGIDTSKLETCKTNNYNTLYASDSALSEGYGVRGSPTLVINGVIAQSGRSPAAYLSTICSAFTDGTAPEECSEELNSASSSPGFGYTASAGGSTNAQC